MVNNWADVVSNNHSACVCACVSEPNQLPTLPGLFYYKYWKCSLFNLKRVYKNFFNKFVYVTLLVHFRGPRGMCATVINNQSNYSRFSGDSNAGLKYRGPTLQSLSRKLPFILHLLPGIPPMMICKIFHRKINTI